MQAGKLRHRVRLERLTPNSPQQYGTGEPDSSWVLVDTVWADIRPLGGRELFLAQQSLSRVDSEIEIRYRADAVATNMRAVHGSTIYNIEAVINPQERNVRLILRCSSGLNQG